MTILAFMLISPPRKRFLYLKALYVLIHKKQQPCVSQHFAFTVIFKKLSYCYTYKPVIH